MCCGTASPALVGVARKHNRQQDLALSCNCILNLIFKWQTLLHTHLIRINHQFQVQGLASVFLLIGLRRSVTFGMVLCSSVRSGRRDVTTVV